MTPPAFAPCQKLQQFMISVALASACALAPSPARAENPSAEEEQRRLEEELRRELGAGVPSSPPAAAPSVGKLLPDISLIGTFAANWFSDRPTLRFPAHEPLHRGPQLQEIELAFRSNIDPYLRADVYLAISEVGLEVEEAYFTTLGLPYNLQLRGGSMYAPFGRFNQTHYLEQTPFVDMPLPNRRFFGGEQLRGLGAELSFLLPLPFFMELQVAALGAGNEVSFGVPAFEIEEVSDLLGVARLSTSLDLGGRLTWILGASFVEGPNASGGEDDHGHHRTRIWGADLTLRLRDVASRGYTALQAEYMYRDAEVPGGGFQQGGAYAWLVRRFDAHWEAAIRADMLGLPNGRSSGHPALGGEHHAHALLEPHHDHGHPTAEGEFGEFLLPARQRRVGASVSYYVSEFHRIRLQANYDFGLFVGDEGAKGVQEYFLQYQFVMGSHGAHPF